MAHTLTAEKAISAVRGDARRKAWDALGRYKFWMFGYHAARWVTMNNLIVAAGGDRLPNPFTDIVKIARRKTP